MKSRFKKIQPGCLFRFGDANKGWGYGVVFISDINLFIGVYEPLISSPHTDIKEISHSPILLLGWTMDARFYSQDWERFSKVDALPEINFPVYKVGRDEKIWITEVNGKILRRASKVEARNLSYKFCRSPIGYEKAFWAYHSKQEWECDDDKLLYRNQST